MADYLAEIRPATAYLAIPTRPPAEPDTAPPDEATLVRAYQQLSARLPRVETLISDEGEAFASTGRIEDDLLAVTAVHPLREEDAHALLAKADADWPVAERLLATGALRRVEYQAALLPTQTAPAMHLAHQVIFNPRDLLHDLPRGDGERPRRISSHATVTRGR